jgi:glycerol-3-phosphate acyltransferase PlsX
MWGLSYPAVRLLSMSGEIGKGNKILKKAETILLDNSFQKIEPEDANNEFKRNSDGSLIGKINYRGLIEGDDVYTAPGVNVIVCSGEMGNTGLKFSEGALKLIKKKMGFAWKAISFFWNHHKRADYKEVGGAILLGINGVLIISHGKSDSLAIANAIRRAKQEVQAHIVQKISERI